MTQMYKNVSIKLVTLPNGKQTNSITNIKHQD